ncbi:type I restriction-modification system subunit M [Leucobacter luti]|uniref:type I restriction-modification system subunit M n=1 Tax=Leucobacter luti TaxID=340320 RepID=UPI003D03C130
MTNSTPPQAQRVATTENVVWATADKFLRNVVEETEYGDYILPFTVLRRLECLLSDTKAELIEVVDALIEKDTPVRFIDAEVKRRFGLSFYNTSALNLKAIAATDDHVEASVLDYIAGFSHNIADIWTSFEFPRLVKKLADANRLHAVVRHFSTLDLSAEAMPNTAMGDLFENVMYRAFDKKGKAAGAFYTPRDAIKLMVDVLFASDEESLTGQNTTRSIYDPTAGSGGMLLVGKDHLTELNPDIEVNLFGQELMDSAFALGKADLLIQGGLPDAIRQGDTLIRDEYADRQFDYVLSNPPFGSDWDVQYKDVLEQSKTPGSRFSHGLPSKSDGQMLFLAHCASKLSPAGKAGHGGRAAVVSNASPLFNSDKGPNAIRQWLFDEDLIDAIIALPTQMFYGTGIATYVWILDTNKEAERKGKIQLIDGSGLWDPMRKPMGDKRREMSEPKRKLVHEAYKAFENADPAISRVFTKEDFMFRDVTVFKQARLATAISEEALEKIAEHKNYTDAHAEIIRGLSDVAWNDLATVFSQRCKNAGLKAPIGLVNMVTDALGVQDDAAPLAVDRKGNPVLLDGWKITERVPMSDDLDDHMAREVIPFAEGAAWDESKAKSGNEIPFTRIFYVPEEPRPLEEIDADVTRLMGELAEMFQAVHNDA